MESREIFDCFYSRKCSVCGGRKTRGSAFCRYCYAELPAALQRSLWKRFSEGFEEAYQASLSWFRVHPFEGTHRAKQMSLFGGSE